MTLAQLREICLQSVDVDEGITLAEALSISKRISFLISHGADPHSELGAFIDLDAILERIATRESRGAAQVLSTMLSRRLVRGLIERRLNATLPES